MPGDSPNNDKPFHHYISPVLIESAEPTGPSRDYNIYSQQSPLRYETENKLSQWWLKNRDDIKNEFEKNLSQIKNQSVKDYIRTNFNNRFDSFNEWSESVDRFGADNHDPLTSSTSTVSAEIVPYKKFKKKLD
jgi:hypothetical protein